MDLTRVDIVELDPRAASDDELAAWHDVLVAATVHDLPDDPLPARSDTVGELRHPAADRRCIHWLGHRPDAPAAICTLTLLDAPNDQIGEIDLQVTPALRRQGFGRALLGLATERLYDEGRATMTADVADGSSGTEFATVMGFEPALAERGSVVKVSELDGRFLDEIVSRTPAGYRVLRWPDHVPDEFADAYAAAKAAMSDAPTGDLVWRAPPSDPARLREAEETMRRRGWDWRVVVAVHEESKDVAGLTEVSVPGGNPRRAMQEDTAVVRAHRGHGLGLVIKAEMLRWVRSERPDVAEIETWNAHSNAHMLAINDRLGFRPDRTWIEYQADIATVMDRLRP